MAGGLRYETGREMPSGMQEIFANHIVEEITKREAEQIACEAMLKAALKMVDADCSFCKYAGGKLPCEEESIAFPCAGCQYGCPCNGCRENSQYEWCGAEEALMRLAEMGEKYAEKK